MYKLRLISGDAMNEIVLVFDEYSLVIGVVTALMHGYAIKTEGYDAVDIWITDTVNGKILTHYSISAKGN